MNIINFLNSPPKVTMAIGLAIMIIGFSMYCQGMIDSFLYTYGILVLFCGFIGYIITGRN